MSRNSNNNNILIPQAENQIDNLKYEVTTELGLPQQIGINQVNNNNYNQFLNNLKNEVSQELGLQNDITSRGWKEMTSRECGLIGGHMGGKIGGNMVRKMVKFAEESLAQRYNK